MKFTRLAVSILAAAPVLANAGSFYVTPGASYGTLGNIAKDDFAPQVGAGYKFANGFGLEAVYNQGTAGLVDSAGNRFTNGDNIKNDGTADYQQYHVDGLYFLPTNLTKVEPYVVAGLGEVMFKKDALLGATDNKGSYLQANAGVGAMIGLTENVKARLDGRYINWTMGSGTGTDNSTDAFQANIGLTYDFGTKPVEVIEAPVVVAPIVVVTPPPAAPVDTDNDGVTDDLDQCPATPVNYAVDAKGCPVELTQPISIPLQILFDTNKSVVKTEFSSEIAKVAEFMTVYPNATAVIEGYTDNRGSDKLNQKLSESRAQAVRTALTTGFGIDPARLGAVGYGEANPVADNATAEGRTMNRRVVAVVSGEKTVIKTR